MATLFPIVEKVDEDETSKIIKNVLFDEQQELDQIFDEFIHLTKKSIIDDDDDDDDEEDHDNDDDEDHDEDDDDDKDEEEDEGDDDDADDDSEDNDDEDDGEDEEDEGDDDDDDEEEEDDTGLKTVKEQNPPDDSIKSHEPQTWNLDQFIPVVKSEPEIKASPSVTKPASNASTTTTIASTSSVTSSVSNSTSSSRNSNYLVQIDLSKLKRIPSHKMSAISTAKALKHEADAEKDKTKQALKYLESAMYFVQHGYELESSHKTSINDHTYYVDTIPLFKHALKLSMPNHDNQDNMTNLKVHTLGLRCTSLLHMKLYKINERELQENNKIIQQNHPVPLPEGILGVKPKFLNAYRKQIGIYSNLRYAIDYWHQADQFCEQHPAVRIFFTTIESNVGALTQTSTIPRLMDHVKCGLKLLRS